MRQLGGTFSLRDRNTLIYRLAFAVWAGRNGKPVAPVGFVPSWVSELRLAKEYGARGTRVDFRLWVWRQRALLLMEASNRSWEFEAKK